MAWQDYRASGGTVADIYAQRLDASGVPQWTANGVALCVTPVYDYFPVIASDGAGGAIVAWHDGNADVYAQRIDASGTVVWTANGVPVCTASLQQMYPAIASDGAGGAYVAWHDSRGGNYDVYAQRLDASGAPLWTPGGVSVCAAAGHQRYPVMIVTPAFGALVAWQDERSGNMDNYAQRIMAAGTVQWGASGLAVCAEGGDQYEPRMAPLGTGVVVVWSDERDPDYSVVYAQRISPSGIIQWTPGGVRVSPGSSWCAWPQVATAATDRAVIVWSDDRDYFFNIYAQMINVDGALIWDPAGVPVCEEGHSQAYPLVAPGGVGGVIVAWEDERGPTYDQYAQRLDGSGEVKWAVDGISVCAYASAQQHAAITPDELGGAIVVWDDDRPIGSKDIYAQRIYFNGDVATGITPALQPCLDLRPAYPNPFNPATTIAYSLPGDGWVKVVVHDVSGHPVRTLVDRRQTAGDQRIDWDGRDDGGAEVSTGVYFVRLESGGETRSVKTVFLK